jgi:hypothetical protein
LHFSITLEKKNLRLVVFFFFFCFREKMAEKAKKIIATILLVVTIAGFIALIVSLTVLDAKKTSNKCPTCPTCAAPVSNQSCSCTLETGKRYVGAASENINGPGGINTANATECQASCRTLPNCKQWVFFEPNKLCYRQTTVPDATPPISDSRFTSGYCTNC